MTGILGTRKGKELADIAGVSKEEVDGYYSGLKAVLDEPEAQWYKRALKLMDVVQKIRG